MKTRILLAHSRGLMRAGLKALLHNNGYAVVAVAENGESALGMVVEHSPDVVVVDLAMSAGDDANLIRTIKKKTPQVYVIALLNERSKAHVTVALKAGASGVLWDNCNIDELHQGLETVVQNQTYLSPSIAHLLVDEYVVHPKNTEKQGFLGNLTNRQKQVLQHVSDGMTTKEIALQLEISPKTVDAHKQDLMTKLDIFSIAGLTKIAIREGLTSLDVY